MNNNSNDSEKLKTTTGIITEDQATQASIGDELHFRSVNVSLKNEANAVWLRNWELFEGILLALTFINDESHSILGSAVLVAPGIALTATHVVEPYIKDIMGGTLVVMALGIAAHGLQVWRVKTLTIAQNTDITIIGLVSASALPPDRLFNLATITTRLPSIGEKVFIVGFRASTDSFKPDSGGKHQYEGNVIVCTGVVSEHYLTGRDRSMLPWSTLEVSCPSWGGMSGGPVFDEQGKLLGLLSSSFTLDDNNGPSYVSLLWAALGTRFNGGWPPSIFEEKRSLLEIPYGLCAIDKPDAVKVLYNMTDGSHQIQYEVWNVLDDLSKASTG